MLDLDRVLEEHSKLLQTSLVGDRDVVTKEKLTVSDALANELACRFYCDFPRRFRVCANLPVFVLRDDIVVNVEEETRHKALRPGVRGVQRPLAALVSAAVETRVIIQGLWPVIDVPMAPSWLPDVRGPCAEPTIRSAGPDVVQAIHRAKVSSVGSRG